MDLLRAQLFRWSPNETKQQQETQDRMKNDLDKLSC